MLCGGRGSGGSREPALPTEGAGDAQLVSDLEKKSRIKIFLQKSRSPNLVKQIKLLELAWLRFIITIMTRDLKPTQLSA